MNRTLQLFPVILLIPLFQACEEPMERPDDGDPFSLNLESVTVTQPLALSTSLRIAEDNEETRIVAEEDALLATLTGQEHQDYLEYITAIRESVISERETHAIVLGDLQVATERYYEEFTQIPNSLETLVESGHLDKLIAIPEDKYVFIHGQTLIVSLENRNSQTTTK